VLSELSLSSKIQPKLATWAPGGISTSFYVLLTIKVEISVLKASLHLLVFGEFIAAL